MLAIRRAIGLQIPQLSTTVARFISVDRGNLPKFDYFNATVGIPGSRSFDGKNTKATIKLRVTPISGRNQPDKEAFSILMKTIASKVNNFIRETNSKTFSHYQDHPVLVAEILKRDLLDLGFRVLVSEITFNTQA